MLADFHFLRPWWLLGLLLLSGLMFLVWRQTARAAAWNAVCDAHLLTYLLRGQGTGMRHRAILFLFFSGVFAVLSLAGPTWSRLPVPAYQVQQPTVVLLNLSENMLTDDITPNRLMRAKFKLHDLFTGTNQGQFGLVVYTGQPFVVSPLTEDGKTIDSLLQTLTPDIMPVGGDNLASALEQGAELIKSAGFNQGKLLVMTSTPPDASAMNTATKLAQKAINTSIMPMLPNPRLSPLFQPLAKAGHGVVLPFSDSLSELSQWLSSNSNLSSLARNDENDIPIWRDEGRWFLLPALVLLLPVFRRGWLVRMDT
jgi:Ca-activated chloride channel family protein